MKHLRLLVALLALFTGGSNLFAQTWTGSTPEDGKVYYLYNAGKKLYLTGDNDWGTHASCTRYGLDFTFAKVNDGVYTLDSKISNGGVSHFLNGNYVDGAAQNWTFTSTGDSDNSFFINNGSGNLYAVSSNTMVEVGDVNDAFAKWVLLTKEDITSQMQSATKDAPVDITILISAANRSRNNLRNDESWTVTRSGGNWNTNQYSNWPAIESWNNTFEYSQTLTDMPLGDYTIGCAGFGTNGTTMLFINDGATAMQIQSNTSTHGTDYAAAAQSIHEEEAGIMGNISDIITVTSSTMKLGLKRTTNKSADWAVFDKFNLMYYGIDLSSFATALSEAVAAAEALEGTVPSAAYTALKAIVDENNKTYTSVADYTAATNAITEATNNAKAMQAPYNNYKVARANVVALKSQTTFVDEGGAAATQLDTDITAADAAAEASTTVEAINAAIKQVRSAAGTFAGTVKVNKGEYLDLTDAMLFNAAMRETGGLSLWNIVSNTNPAYPMYNGRCSEFWSANFEFNQTAYNMPAGNYNIEVYAFHRAGTYNTYLYANNDKIQVLPIANGENSMDAAANAFDQGLYLNSLKITLDEAQNVVIGFKNEDGNETDKWTIFRDFKIKFFGDDALAVFRDEYESALAEAETALASEDYANVTGEEKTALNTAVTETYPKTVVEVDETQEKFETATTALKEVTTTFKNAKAAYDKFAAAKAAAASNKVDYPYASAEKLAAYQANLTDATTATEANTKANAIVTTYRTYVESNALAEGVEGAVDLTSKIKQDAIADWTAEITGSTATFVLKNADGNDPDTYTAADGTKGKNLIDSGDLWGATAWTAKMTQNVNLTPGKYILTASSRGSNDLSTFKLLADDKSVDMDHTGAAEGNGVFDRGFNDYYVEFELTETKDVVIGFEAATEVVHNWCSVARFRLAQLESTTEWATNEDLTAFAEALQVTAKLGFDEGDYAPYNNVESLTAAEAEAAKVTTELEAYEGKATKATVAAATEAVKALTWVANEAEVNAVYDGTFANAEHNGAPAGWTMSNNTLGGDYHSRAFNPDDRLAEFNETKSGFFIRFDGTNSNRGSMYFYGKTTGYTMPLKANTTYYVKADFAGWGSTGKPLRMNVTGPEGFSAVGSTQTTAVRADNADETPQQFLIVFTTADAGNYEINFQTPGADSNTHNALVSNVELFKVITLSDTNSDELPAAVNHATTVTLTRKFVNKWNPICLPFEVTDFSVFGDNCEVVKYTGDEMTDEDHLNLKFETVTGKMDANVPYMVWIDENADVTNSWNLTFTGVNYNPSETPVSTGTNYNYVGVYKNYAKGASPIATGDIILSSGAYKTITGNGGNAIKGFRGYWKKCENASEAKSISAVIDGQETNDIKYIELIETMTEGIYNLQGQKVNRAQKGVYIVNGKKVVVK